MSVRRLLVGVDGSIPSIQALRWAVALGRPLGAVVHVVHAFEPVQSEKPPGVLERLIADAHQHLASWCAAELSDVEHVLHAVPGDPRQVLPALMADHDIDLLVLSTLGATGAQPGLFRFGSVTEFIVRIAPGPMVVIPPTGRADAHAQPMRRVLLCSDGSDPSQAAVAWLRDLEVARGQVAEVAPIYVEPGAVDPASSIDAEILLAAEETNADTIVMGTRGSGGFSGLRLGGVALGVVRRARCPVVLIPPGS
jgi:nucleotide-binding universal stress UspA family protein